MPNPKEITIGIQELKMETMIVNLIGTSGMYHHRMAAKVRASLLLGGGKKTAAEKLDIKHFPREEFRDCMDVIENAHEHTNVVFPSMALKSAMQNAALVTAGLKKSDTQKLLFFPQETVPIFGIPVLRMTIMRSSDMARTPDVRTRAYFPEWGTQVEISFVTPQLSKKAILSLLTNAGMVIGIGDERQERGKGSAGRFKVSGAQFPKALLNRKAQWKAIQDPQPYGPSDAELLANFDQEVVDRS